MKFLKKFVITISLLILVVAGVGMLLPATTHVSRSIEINRDAGPVFEVLNDYREFNKWSPWARRDPDTVYNFSGPVTGVGSRMSWQSDNPQVGTGSQEIIESIENEIVRVKLSFEGQGDAIAYFQLEPQGSATRVTWAFDVEHGKNPVSRYFGLMLDRWVGADYAAGLQNLQQLLEK